MFPGSDLSAPTEIFLVNPFPFSPAENWSCPSQTPPQSMSNLVVSRWFIWQIGTTLPLCAGPVLGIMVWSHLFPRADVLRGEDNEPTGPMCQMVISRQWEIKQGALAGVAEWVGHHPANLKVTSSFLVRAHAWVAGSGPIRGTFERQ